MALFPAGIRVVRRARLLRPGSGFVPTMGALHEGHLALVKRALEENRRVVVSIFVNPTQFGPREDFKKYPRALARDCRLLARAGKLTVFAPPVAEVYPRGFSTTVKVGGSLGQVLEAEERPGHFDGVATVVARLFNLVRPRKAYFGLKDYQQCRVVARMVEDLKLPLELEFRPTVRAKDGLALSSRNAYLSPAERLEAPALYKALKLVRARLRQGQAASKAEAAGRALLGAFRVQYLKVADAASLGAPSKGRPKVVAAAAFLGKTRLIDNVKV